MQNFSLLTPNEQDILFILMNSTETIYGLEIFNKINENREINNFRKPGYGSFYAALKKLEREQLIESSTPGEDQRKKFYKITADGKNILNKNQEYQQFLYLQTQTNSPGTA
jgi:DNA-binding PadR family transcriptional regulator